MLLRIEQQRRIQEFAEKKGWKFVRWYEEPEQSAKYEEIEERPVFAQLLNEAGKQFQIVLCYMNNRWSRNVVVAFTSLTRLRQSRVWWATADGLWDIDKVQQDGFDVAFAVDTQINASSTWRPPRMHVRPDSVTFPALVRIGELTAQGWSDSTIADELEGYLSYIALRGKALDEGHHRSYPPVMVSA